MTGVALSSLHRGACPGLSAPMLTGDGLLVRLLPSGTISRDAFRTLCTAAQEHGNGVIEITARGSIQIRGLTAASAVHFAATIAESGIAAADAPPVLSSPLAGLAANEILDASALAEALRQALAKTSLPPRLASKLSVVIDGGGGLNLDHLSADVRLCAESTDGEPAIRISVAGDHASALMLGMVALNRAIEVTLILLDAICRSGHDARARDIVAADGGAEFRTTIADFLIPDRSPAARTPRQSNDPIGDHALRDGTFARGFGLAFGHAEAKALAGLIEAAAGAGATGVRAAPGRALLVVGLTQDAAATLAATAETNGFVVRADDPRRFVFACAGAPVCSSAHIAARTLAPRLAEIAAARLGPKFDLHISGCVKGCAHPQAAALTIVGTDAGCALIARGNTRGTPVALISSEELPDVIAQHAAQQDEGQHV